MAILSAFNELRFFIDISFILYYQRWAGQDRTADPYNVNVVLVPLSYTPIHKKLNTFIHTY